MGQMGDVLAALRLATDTQLLQYPTVHRDSMAAGVRQYDHGIRFGDGPTNVGLLDDISLGELDAVVVLAGISVRDDHRTPEGGVGITVPDCAFHLVLRGRHAVESMVGQGGVIHHVRISATFPHLLHDGGDVFRTEDRSSVPLSIVNLDGNLVAFFKALVELGFIK